MSGRLVCDPERMNVERMAAWGLVIGGGVFWTVASFFGPYTFINVNLTHAIGTALIPLALTVVVFLVGLRSEIAASALLIALTLGGLIWGVGVGWEPLVWGLMLAVFALPMTAAGVMYFLAWRMENACGGARAAIAMLDLDL